MSIPEDRLNRKGDYINASMPMDEQARAEMIEQIEDVSDRRPYQDLGQLTPYYEKYGDAGSIKVHMKSIANARPESALFKDTADLLESLGYARPRDPMAASMLFYEVNEMYADPLGGLERDLSSRYQAHLNRGTAGQQLAQEGGFTYDLGGRSIMSQSGTEGAFFTPMAGSFSRDDIIKQIEFREKYPDEPLPNAGPKFMNWNNITSQEMAKELDSRGVSGIGLGADYPGTFQANVRTIKYKDPTSRVERLYTEYVGTLSEKQRGLVGSTLNLPSKLTFIDSESFYAVNLLENMVTSASKLMGIQDPGFDKDMMLIKLANMDPGDRKNKIAELIQGKTNNIIDDAYAVSGDYTALLQTGRVEKALSIADEVEFVRGKTAEESISGLYNYLDKIRTLHKGGSRIAGLNIIKHDIPAFAYFARMTGQYYEAQEALMREGAQKISDLGFADKAIINIEEAEILKLRKEAMFDWSGSISGTGLVGDGFYGQLVKGETAAFDITTLYRAMPTLDRRGGWYLGEVISGEEERILGAVGKPSDRIEASARIAEKRIHDLAVAESIGKGKNIQKALLKSSKSGYSGYAAKSIEDAFHGNELAMKAYYGRLTGQELVDPDALLRLYKDGSLVEDTLEQAFVDIRKSTLSTSWLGGESYQVTSSADRFRIQEYWTLRQNKASIMAEHGLTGAAFEEIISGAHEGRVDARLSAIMYSTIIRRTKEKGEVIANAGNAIPEEQWRVGLIEQLQKEALDSGEDLNRTGVLAAGKGRYFVTGADQDIMEFALRRLGKQYEVPTTGILDDVANRLMDESVGVNQRVINASRDIANRVMGAERRVADEAVEGLATSLNVPIREAFDLIEKARIGQRWVVGGGLAIAGLIAVTNKMKEKTQTYDAWKMGEVEQPGEQQASNRIRQYQQDMAQMGDMTIESSNRRNYSYNQNNNRHDHLFRE
jgi:hypothetical protein